MRDFFFVAAHLQISSQSNTKKSSNYELNLILIKILNQRLINECPGDGHFLINLIVKYKKYFDIPECTPSL